MGDIVKEGDFLYNIQSLSIYKVNGLSIFDIRTYLVKFKNYSGEVKFTKIDDELYQKVYKKYNN